MTSSSPETDSPIAALPLLREAAEAVGDARASQLVRAVEEHVARSKLRLLVVGTSGAGRATLVNALLGLPDLLPRSPLPKAPLSLVIRFGAGLTLQATDMRGMSVALAPSDLRSLLYQPDAAYRGVEIHVPAEPLKTCDIRIEPLEAPREPNEWDDLLAGTDFALLVLRAPAVLSATERDFVREHLVKRGLDRVALLVNQIDLVDEEERGEVLGALSRFLGPFESQPVILDISAAGAVRGGSDAEALERLMRDVVGRRDELRQAGLLAMINAAVNELVQGAARRDAVLALDEEQARRVRQTLAGRSGWLEERVGRMQHRVTAFVGTLIGGRARHDVEEFGTVFRRRLPAEIEAVSQVATVKRFLPGYIEQVWQEFLRNEALILRRAVDDEIAQMDTIIREDLRGLLGGSETLLSAVTDINPESDTPDSFVMPRRGAHFASSIAKGLSYQGLFLTIWSLPLGLASLGAGHLVRRIYRPGIEESDRKAYAEAAIAASHEFEEEVLRRLDQDMRSMTDELREAVATVYQEAAQRVDSLLSTHESRGRDTAVQREEIAHAVNRLVLEIRAVLRRVEAI